MDQIDEKILECLKQNAREKASAIAERISLSVSAVIERIRKLEGSGVIRGYTVVLDQKKLGNDLAAYMEVSLEHPKYYDNFTKLVRANPHVTDCSYITGDFDFLLKVMTDSSDGLEKLHREIKEIKGVMSTKTYFVLSTVKDQLM